MKKKVYHNIFYVPVYNLQ